MADAGRSLSERAQKAARRDPSRAPFASFFERDEVREVRRRRRRRTVVISILVHGLALAALLVYSLWGVDELFGPSVEVRIFSPAKAPGAAPVPAPARPAPATPPAPAGHSP